MKKDFNVGDWVAVLQTGLLKGERAKVVEVNIGRDRMVEVEIWDAVDKKHREYIFFPDEIRHWGEK